jgi:hypothetical protein
VDADPRSIYFKQAARGVPIRMAILSVLTGSHTLACQERPSLVEVWPVLTGDNPCPNPSCISRTEPRHVTPLFSLASRAPMRAHCAYCSRELVYRFVGCSSTRHYHRPEASALRKVRPDHLVFLRDEEAAAGLEFRPAAGAGAPR